MIKPLEAIGLLEDEEIVVHVPEEKAKEEEGNFFFPSAFDFWNDAREDLHSENIS